MSLQKNPLRGKRGSPKKERKKKDDKQKNDGQGLTE